MLIVENFHFPCNKAARQYYGTLENSKTFGAFLRVHVIYID